MIRILVGSLNPVKVDSVRLAFGKFHDNMEVEGISVESGVPDQPIDLETFDGALNRVTSLHKTYKGFDYYVGIEGGLFNYYSKWFAKGVVCIKDASGNSAFGESASFEIPDYFMEKINAGMELGHVIDEVTSDKNTKQKGGAIGHLTNNVMTRKDLYIPGIIAALVPFINRETYF